MASIYDAIVVGLGAMGSAAACELAQRGKRVLGLERYTAAHDKGSSHGHSRIIRQAYFEHPDYVPLLLRAYELWKRLERASDRRLLTITGGLMMGPPNSDVVAGAARSAREHSLPHEMLDAAEIRRRFPPFNPGPETVALYEPIDGVLEPEACIRAFLDCAARLGAEMRFEEPALSWQAAPSGDGVRVTTGHGVYEAARLVVAPGAWAPALLSELGLPLTVERQVLYWFEPLGGGEPFLPDRFPIYIWEVRPGIDLYGFPAQDGPPGGVKVAFYRLGDEGACTPETIDRTVQPFEVERMRAALAECIPSLNGELRATLTCMYTNTPDQHFVIGRHPRQPQVVVASPCSGHGFKFASVIGEILADLALDGATRHPIGLFDIGRFAVEG
ncbi:MAG: N-methyl-L-tryptophan oxidase [Roseiflexaceae bacterium]